MSDNKIDAALSSSDQDQEELDDETPDTDDAPSDDPLADDEELQQAFYDLYLECCGEDRYPRLIEVKDVKQAENYWAGRQYEYWSTSDKTWKPTPQTGSGWGDMGMEDMPRYEYVTNIYQARGLMVVGAVAGAVPRIRFFPDDADDSKDIETAEGRTKLAKLIQRWNPPQQLLQEEAYHAWTGGFIAWWTRYVANGEKYGIDSVNLLSQGAESVGSTIHCAQCGWSAPADQAEPPVPCPQCGKQLTQDDISEEESIPVPEDGGTEEIPKGRQVISVYGALNAKRPQHTNHQSQWHYFAIEEEMHYSILRAAFPDAAEKLKPGLTFGSDDVYERNARLSIAENAKSQSQTGAAQASLATFARIWFRPSSFTMIKDKTVRARALEIAPRGIRVEFAGRAFCKSEAQSMDDCIATTHAMPGRGQHRQAIGSSMLSVQDRVNVFTNIQTETYEYGIPITYRASDTFSPEANEDQRAAPGLEVEVMLQPGQDLRSKIMQVRADSASPDMAQHTLELMGAVSDQLSGAYPALSGAGADAGAPDTLGQQSMQRDQAMGRMGIFYVPLKQAHADIMTLSCRDFEAHTDGEVKIPVLGNSGDFESESVDVSALEGEAEAYPEGDENFPELWNQQRATLMQIMDSPFGAELAKEPGNAELIVKMTGIPDLKVPQMDAWRKQLKEIAELTKIPDGDDLLEGIAPMVEVDPKHDDNATEAECCKWWANNEVGQKMKRSNPLGFQAVLTHWDQHTGAIPPPPPPEKPMSPTVTTAFKDMPPEAQAQYLEKEFGIKVDAQAFMQQVALEQAKKTPKPAPGMPPQAGPPKAGPANAVGG